MTPKRAFACCMPLLVLLWWIINVKTRRTHQRPLGADDRSEIEVIGTYLFRRPTGGCRCRNLPRDRVEYARGAPSDVVLWWRGRPHFLIPDTEDGGRPGGWDATSWFESPPMTIGGPQSSRTSRIQVANPCCGADWTRCTWLPRNLSRKRVVFDLPTGHNPYSKKARYSVAVWPSRVDEFSG